MLAIIVCAGRSTVGERVRGLRLGADDWIAETTPIKEIAARIERATRDGRRTVAPAGSPPFRFGQAEL
jgi:DNA-binding response OmpR family regulator